MNNVIFRKKTLPQRTCTKTFSTYQKFKSYLRKDFNERCGYTDCADKWFGGVTTFHIDHFESKKHNPELATTYSNLVYSCSYVNILKSDDNHGQYLEPCSVDYNDHFYRDKLGTIFPNPESPKAIYMHKKLKMGLWRYQVIWQLDTLYECMDGLEKLLETLPKGGLEESEAKSLYVEFGKEFRKYFDYLTK